jgi:SNF2 family DNA or RNA helicase
MKSILIKVEVPKEQIPYIRMIEGRKFKDGFWLFPESSLPRLKELKLVDGELEIVEKSFKQFELSPHLYKYQKEVVSEALNYGSYGYFADTGTGKSHMGLETASHYNKTLVVCPLSIIENVWLEECEKWYPSKKIISLWDISKKRRLEKLQTDADIYVINFEGLKIIYNEITKKGFDCFIVDESSKLKNHKSEITQIVLKLSERVRHKYLLSGCPAPNHNSEIFAQMKIINPEILGVNYYGFLAKYFNQDMENPHRWYQTDENKEKFFSRLGMQSRFLRKEDCLDLPEKIFLIRKFELGKDQRKYYDNMIQDIKDNINTWSKFEFTAKLMKLRQILSGFVINKDETTSEFSTQKDIELEGMLDELGDKQVVIWCQFIHEIEKLSEKYNGIGLTSKTKNRDQIIRDFKSGKIKRLFVHPKLLGKGQTFVNCNYNIYYSLSFSYEEFKQSQDRIHRDGQINKCTYIVLQGKDTIDENIYRCLKNKKSAVDELYINLGMKIEN